VLTRHAKRVTLAATGKRKTLLSRIGTDRSTERGEHSLAMNAFDPDKTWVKVPQ
jgi:hypothetical protein